MSPTPERIAIDVASAVTTQFALFAVAQMPPPTLDAMRAITTAAVYKAALNSIKQQQQTITTLRAALENHRLQILEWANGVENVNAFVRDMRIVSDQLAALAADRSPDGNG